jgi:hypothetical protein
MQRLHDAGAPLTEYSGRPYRGVLTGLNEAFFVDTLTRDRLVARDPRSAELLKPLLRGQDIDRWASEWPDLWLIFTRHGTNIDEFPAIKAHLEPFRISLEPKPVNWQAGERPGRKPGTYHWWEIQDNVAYFEKFTEPKIIYQEIQFYPAYSADTNGLYLNNKGFLLPSSDPWLLAVLNSPLLWWFGWRHFPHMKDEALTPAGFRMETMPIARPIESTAARVAEIVRLLPVIVRQRHAARRALRGWLATTWDLPRPPQMLTDPFALSADAFAQALRAALPARRRNLSAAAVSAIRTEHAATVAPVATRLAEASRLENELSRLVNQAYGMTEEDERLMWATRPPRMPIAAPARFREADGEGTVTTEVI